MNPDPSTVCKRAECPQDVVGKSDRSFFWKASFYLPLAIVVAGVLSAILYTDQLNSFFSYHQDHLRDYLGSYWLRNFLRTQIIFIHIQAAAICALMCSVLAFVRSEKKAALSLVTALPSLGLVLFLIIKLIGE